MLFAKYHFKCQLEDDAILPPYKGSTFRGLFGRALKKVACALKRIECQGCLLRQNCVYALAFEIPVSKGSDNTRLAAPPNPFVIEPPLTLIRKKSFR